jgi:hypothetical protein
MNSDSSNSSDSSANPNSAANVSARIKLAEVKYSLVEMLEELKAERTTSTFAMEQLDQREIGKLFKNKATRAKSKTKK